jgi:acetyl esterase
MVEPQVKRLLASWATLRATAVSDLTATTVRIDDLGVIALQGPLPPLYAVEDLELAGSPALTARIYRPKPGPLPLMIFFHGGGFVIGAAAYEQPLRELAGETGCLVAAPNVRLAPEHRFPAALDDAVTSAHRLIDLAPALGATGQVGIAGDSSGGNLAASVTRTLSRAQVHLDFQVLIYPMLDATAGSPSYTEFATGYGFTREKSLWYFNQYLEANVDRRHPSVSPLFEQDLTGLPRTLVITAENDPLRDEGELYAAHIRDAGGAVELRRYDGMIHGFFQMTAALDGARRAQSDVKHWLRG